MRTTNKWTQSGRGMLSVMAMALLLLMGTWALANPIDSTQSPHPEAEQLVHEAQHAVDEAWEAFHRAALGGTLASPSLQGQIEQGLHEARRLLVQARDRAEQGRENELRPLLERIQAITAEIVQASQEPKQ
jgi:hypothetical protein